MPLHKLLTFWLPGRPSAQVSFESTPDFQIEIPPITELGGSNSTLTPVQNTNPITDATIATTAVHIGMTIRATLLLQDDEATKRAADANSILLPEHYYQFLRSDQRVYLSILNSFCVQTSKFSNGLSRVAIQLQNDQPQRYPGDD